MSYFSAVAWCLCVKVESHDGQAAKLAALQAQLDGVVGKSQAIAADLLAAKLSMER